jgi:type II restriction enzyme
MLLNYSPLAGVVTDFCIVPKYFFALNLIEKRRPLAVTARRAGWVGCNIVLSKIPAAGKIALIVGGKEIPKRNVLSQWELTVFLRGKSVEARGWLMEVMRCVDLIGKAEFKLDEVYAFVPELQHRYPGNQHVEEKIRQQLQVLRDQHYLEFVGRARYRVRKLREQG